jgi:hypothetical protein
MIYKSAIEKLKGIIIIYTIPSICKDQYKNLLIEYIVYEI